MTKKATSSAMTNAERQAAYRARRAETGDGVRFTLMAHADFPGIVKRLAAHHGTTQADALLKAVKDAESDAMKGMSAAERKVYMAGE